jgi:hypothetical protein
MRKAFLLLLLLASCAHSTPIAVPSAPIPVVTSGVVSLVNASWFNYFWEQTPLDPINPDPAPIGWQFSFPQMNPSLVTTADPFGLNYDSVHYEMTQYTAPISLGQSISFTATITASSATVFNWQQSGNMTGLPANCRVMIMRQSLVNGAPDLSLTSVMWQNPDYRWYATNAYMVLQPGTQTVTVAVDPTAWNNVNGALASSSGTETTAFQAALANPEFLALVFGGGSFDGHGTNASGIATFNLTNFQVTN